MKKLSYLIVLALILGLVLTGCSLLSNISQVPATEREPNVGGTFDAGTLVAGKNINVGIVSVWNDGTDLCIEYQLSEDAIAEGWFLTETHWAWATDSADIPQKNGNPIPGQFLYGDGSLPGESSYQECISPSDLPLGTPIFIAAHAVVQRIIGYTEDDPELPIFQTESAWADGAEFLGKNWATYFDYCYGTGVLNAEDSGATFEDNENRTGTMVLTVLDMCGGGIEGLQLADIVLDIQFLPDPTDLATLSAGGYWDIELDETGNGLYEITFHRTGSVPYTRLWDVIVMDEIIEDDLSVLITNPVFVVTQDSGQNAINEGNGWPYIEWEIDGLCIEFTFVNPTNWNFAFDYRVDGEEGETNPWSSIIINGGELVGQEIGPSYNIVNMPAGDPGLTKTVHVCAEEEIWVGMRLGAENDYFLEWIKFEVQ